LPGFSELPDNSPDLPGYSKPRLVLQRQVDPA
jgi:hypothetical protein